MNNDLISRSNLWTDIMMLPHNGDIISSEEVEAAIIEAPAVNAMVIPCKIGDAVWGIRRLSGGTERAMQGAISEMQFVGSQMALSITIRGVCRGEWGKSIFATKEEAEAEIARKRG